MKFRCLFLAAVLAASGVGCFERESDQSSITCEPGVSDICYTGPAETDGVGVCKPGQLFCWERDGKVHQECVNQVLPTAERCNSADDDCDGRTDEDNVCSIAALTIYRDDRVGPAYMYRDSAKALFECQVTTTTGDCAKDLVSQYGAVWGLEDPETSLSFESNSSTSSDDALMLTQMHNGIPVEGHWMAFTRSFAPDPRGNGIVSVRARLADLSNELPSVPVVTAEEIEAMLPDGAVLTEGPDLIYHEQRLAPQVPSTGGGSATYVLAFVLVYTSADQVPVRAWFDALDGKELSRIELVTRNLSTSLRHMPSTI